LNVSEKHKNLICTRPTQTNSCSEETNIFTRLQLAGRGDNYPPLTNGEIKARVQL